MKMKIFALVLASVLPLTPALQAQQSSAAVAQRPQSSIGLFFTAERSQLALPGAPAFWTAGGAVDAAGTVWHGLGVAATLSGSHIADVGDGMGLDKIAFMAGPRYTFAPRNLRRTQIFVEGLFGLADGFDAAFPQNGVIVKRVEVFSMQAGGGVDVPLHKGLCVRALEIDYVRTALPNNAANIQNNLRLGVGISLRR